MTTRRPHVNRSIVELENLARAPDASKAVKREVLAELEHRRTDRAAMLRQALRKELEAARVKGAPAPARARTAVPASERLDIPARAAPAPVRPLDRRTATENDPANILRAWTVLEVLSPAGFKRPADLAGGDIRRIARIEKDLPWDNGPAKGPQGTRLYFQIVLGTLPLEPAYAKLLERFADTLWSTAGVFSDLHREL